MEQDQHREQSTIDEERLEASQPIKKSKSKFFLGLFVGIILAISTTGFVGYQFINKKQQANQDAIGKLSKVIEDNEQSIAILKQVADNRLDEISNQYEEHHHKYQMLTRRLDNVVQTQEQSTPLNIQEKTIWKLAELEYLVKLADLKLNYETDAQTALLLIQQAHVISKQLTHPRYLPIEQSLVITINTLNAIDVVDVGTIVNRLTAVNEQFAQLSLKLSQQETKVVEAKDKAKDLPNNWKANINRALEQFKSLVVIEKLEQPQPLIFNSASANSAIMQNLSLRIVESRISVVRLDQDSFTAQLNEIVSMLETYYEANETQQKLIMELQALSQINLRPTLPELSSLLKLIQEVQAEPEVSEEETVS